ncbi:MAG: NRDE family protein [Planctomycetota bacterium]
MCLLIVLRGRFASHPILVAGNRDERRDRKAAPPGLWVGRRHRVLSPRDRQAGGTWLGVGDHGLFAGLTNIAGVPAPADATTRGALPHLALDQDGLDAAVAAVEDEVGRRPFAGFQLVLADARRVVVLRHDGGLRRIEWTDELLVVSNEHGPGELRLRGLGAAVAPRPSPQEQLEALRPLLLDPGGDGWHAVRKDGAEYGTVSSSLIAVPRPAPQPDGSQPAGPQLVWRYAAGPPDTTPFQNYGNLARRLQPE